MKAYLDTSAILPLFVADDHTAPMQAWSRGHVFLVSDFAALEVAAAMSRAVRMRRVSESTAQQALGEFDAWRSARTLQRGIRSSDIREAERLIRDFDLKLSAPDGLHLATAMEDGAPLVTFDRRLADAARKIEHPVTIPGT